MTNEWDTRFLKNFGKYLQNVKGSFAIVISCSICNILWDKYFWNVNDTSTKLLSFVKNLQGRDIKIIKCFEPSPSAKGNKFCERGCLQSLSLSLKYFVKGGGVKKNCTLTSKNFSVLVVFITQFSLQYFLTELSMD